ncbi:MAG: hypothetical protein JXA14_06020 [Anaerolineae bacterium]|jgi:hypothetical protein|nr:hypothetical protein [Anaerolineae bacterium]
MKATRREFIRRVGVALGSLMAMRCGQTTCYTPEPLPSVTPVLSRRLTPNWTALRECWLDLDNPALRSLEDNDFSRELRQRHDDALAALVDSDELDQAVAAEIDAAFEEAVAHIQRQQATCYIALPPEFTPRDDLMQQAEILEMMAAEGGIEPQTVAQAQAALERDIAWLTQFHAGKVPGELGEIEVTPEAAEAAQILVKLLLGDQRFGNP